jgi:hypothetical protein
MCKIKKIAFFSPTLDVRGTCVSLYDYALNNQTLLGNESVIVCNESSRSTNIQKIHDKFSRQFDIIYCKDNDIKDLDEKIKDCDILYCIKYGKNNGFVSSKVKTVVHCVFDMTEPHGDVYAGVSSQLAQKFNQPLFVPHMIGLTPSVTGENFRSQLHIPESSTVFGRHGGLDTFDLKIAMNAIKRVVRDFPNIYFIFVNTVKFDTHRNIVFLDKIVDLDEKTKFISSCDAMIHAQSLGETFGISIGEFSVNNKPIITYDGPVWNDNYKKILKEKALYYTTEDECYYQLTLFNKNEYNKLDNNCYKDYSPEKVMVQFENIFIK